jgi:hypothetical protein
MADEPTSSRNDDREGRPRELAWARDLARLDDRELASRVESLPLEQQVELVLSLGWQDRLRLIESTDKAAEIVAAMPPEEVLLTLKGVASEDALPIVALTTPEQMRFILDVELWKRDRLDDAKIVEWVHQMLACGESKIIEFAATADIELLTIVLNRLVHLVPNEEGAAIPEDLPDIMPDEFFTILSKFPKETEAVGLLLRILRQANSDFFYRLLFLAHGSLESEAEDEAFRLRNSRLEEVGLLEFDEAVEIYGYIGESEARGLAQGPPKFTVRPEESEVAAPGFPMVMAEKRTFFRDLLTSLEDRALANRLRREIAFSANRLLVADAAHVGELEAMTRALTRLFSLVNVGLLFLTAGDRTEALRILQNLSLRDIFQIGFSRATDLKREAGDLARRFWPNWWTEGFLFLEAPQHETLRGLLMRVPQYCGLGRGEAGFRDFETADEVWLTRRMLAELRVLAEVCFEKLGLPRPDDALPVLGDVFAGGPEDLTLESIFLTGAVNLLVGGNFKIEPLSGSEVQGLFEGWVERSPSGEHRVRRAGRDKILEHLAGSGGFGLGDTEVFEGLVDRGIKSLEDEIGGLDTWRDVDPRYVRSLVFSRRGWPAQERERGGHE